jgi:hypothetical protein
MLVEDFQIHHLAFQHTILLDIVVDHMIFLLTVSKNGAPSRYCLRSDDESAL